MNHPEKRKLVAMNAALLAAAGLASFVLPLIFQSLTDGPANFLIAAAQVGPILAAIPISCSFIGKSLEQSTEQSQ